MALVTRGGNVGRLLLWSWFVNLVLLVLLPPPLGLEKKSSRLVSWLGLGAARLGSEQLASLERAEPSPDIRLVQTASRAESARFSS